MTGYVGRGLFASFMATLILSSAMPAAAQATRTWVSGVGDNANPCSRTAPCRTFAGAFPKTAAGGEINCLDAGIFGMLTITKAISIICEGQAGAIQVENVEDHYYGAVIINAGPNDRVFLRGLNIHGENRAGQVGILFRSGKELHVRNSSFDSLGDCAIAATGSGTVVVDDILSTSNFCGLSFVLSSQGELDFSVSNVRIIDSIRAGIVVRSGSPAASVAGVVSGSQISTTLFGSWGFENHGISATATDGTIHLTVRNSGITGHKVGGIDARGSGAKLLVSGNVIVHNQLGISSQGGAAVASFGDNLLTDNILNGSFTASGTKR